MLKCWVDRHAIPYSEAMLRACDVDSSECIEYQYDLEKRELVRPDEDKLPSWAEDMHDEEAMDFFGALAGTPEALVNLALRGRLTKHELAPLLVSNPGQSPDPRQDFFSGCSALEIAITDRCHSTGVTCFEGGGCPFDEPGNDQGCLQACEKTGDVYLKSCGTIWWGFFRYPKNRIKVWRD